ncbi:MAG: hypothetical protein ACRD3E_17290 [Terriglobales bacterium]
MFTVVCEYGGGTYIRQVRAASSARAIPAWIKSLHPGEMPGIGPRKLKELLDSVVDGTSMPIARVSACDGVWCWSANRVLVHIIRTHDPAPGRSRRDRMRNIEEAEDWARHEPSRRVSLAELFDPR